MTRGSGFGITSLDAVLAAFGLAAHELQAFDPAHAAFDAQRPLLVLAPQFEAAASPIAARYPGGHPARALLGGPALETTVARLPREAEAWLLLALAPKQDLRALAGLRAIMERLYGPEGCPWDREQTHEMLRSYLLEETYEAVEAIDRGDLDELRGELGDLLMQIFLHAAIAQTHGEFTLEDVVEAISAKMVRRHPHVFAGAEAGDAEAVWARWEEIKAEERAAAGESAAERGAFASMPSALPALQRAQTLLGRAERAGLAEPEAEPLAFLDATLRVLEAAPESERGEALAALLWAAVRYARAEDLDAESALRERIDAFVDAADARA